MLDQTTGRIWAADCDTGTCQSCGLLRCHRRARMITHRLHSVSRPRFITLTNAPDQWQARRGQVRDLRRRIERAGLRCEWLWTTERGSKSGAVHCHLLQWGDYLPQSDLQRWWGDRIVDIRSAQPRHGEYISKSAGRLAHYVSKGGVADLEVALSLNGGRLHHWSRGWWGGETVRGYWSAMQGASDADCVLVRSPEARAALDSDRRAPTAVLDGPDLGSPAGA